MGGTHLAGDELRQIKWDMEATAVQKCQSSGRRFTRILISYRHARPAAVL